MTTPVTLQTHISGDTWHGLDLTVLIDGVPMNLTSLSTTGSLTATTLKSRSPMQPLGKC